jgi:SAM-dependent methyltransferase
MPEDADPYAFCAEFYDAEFSSVEADAAWFARTADPAGGPLLVLGCGTGRVCRLLACSRAVTGLDRSEAMLARARAAAERPGEPAVRYVAGDMCDFDCGTGTYAEVFIPNAGFCFLRKRAQQASCLRGVARALRPGGALALDVPMPSFRWLAEPHTEEREAWRGELRAGEARRTREVFREPERGELLLVDRYWFDGERVAESRLELHLYTPAELEWMMEACGFAVESMWGGYGGEPIGQGSERILVRAMRL